MVGAAMTAALTAAITVFGVATPYAWEVVETAWRAGLEPVCVDNYGGADDRLPGLTTEPPAGPFVLGPGGRAAPRRRGPPRLGGRADRAGGPGRPERGGRPAPSELGHGSYVNAGVVVASHARVGCHVNLNRSVSIGHDNDLGFAVVVRPRRDDRRRRGGGAGRVRRRRRHHPPGRADRPTCHHRGRRGRDSGRR